MNLKIAQKLTKLLDYAIPVPHVFNDDIFLVSYPKSGNTWASFLIANVICIESGIEVEVNFFNIQDFIPEYWRYGRFKLRPNGIGKFPRFIKSHDEVCSLFRKVILIVRDPRDVMVSYWHYLKGQGLISTDTTLKELVVDKEKGIAAWARHTRGWMVRATEGKRVHIFRYEDLLEDTSGVLREIFRVIGYGVSKSTIDEAVLRSSLSNMKSIERSTRQSRYHLAGNDFQFVRKGVAGGGFSLEKDCDEFIREEVALLMQALDYKL